MTPFAPFTVEHVIRLLVLEAESRQEPAARVALCRLAINLACTLPTAHEAQVFITECMLGEEIERTMRAWREQYTDERRV